MTTSEAGYRIDMEEDGLVVRVRPGVLDREAVARFLDFLTLESLRRRSELTAEDAGALADDVDRAAWERVRHRVPNG